ncbi:tail sheath protein [Paraglaciecola Antarctic GD virus 1]|nr:tail sheath protein [Paraglaciecola Antarctic GD virus 1]
MALISAGVETTEIDLTSTINNASTGRAALVGQFAWGATDVIKQITSEAELVRFYGAPTDGTFASFFSAANFLSYGNDLRVLRAVRSDATAASYISSGLSAKYVGEFGNRLSIEILNGGSFLSEYAAYHPYQLEESENVIVVRLDGEVVESHFVAIFRGEKDIYNNNLYVQDVLERSSNYLIHDGTSEPLLAVDTFMNGGSDGVADDLPAAYTLALDAFEDRYSLYANLFIAGDAAEVGDNVVTKLIDIMELRQDAIAFISPRKVDVVDASDVGAAITNITNYKFEVNINSTYVSMDGNYKYQYDKYNDVYRWVPLNGDIAGLCVFTDNVAAPWFSPAGVNRGQIRGVTKLALTTNQSFRDSLYEAGINPVVAFSGQGFFLYGDKTTSTRPTAFDRINVRRLFNVLKKAISDSSQFSLFELNDNFTRVSFKAEVDQYLQSIKAQRGILDFFVVVDETNNTAQVIDTNNFIADIYIKPARSINFIHLNFIATGSGVDFEELLTR